MYAVPNISNRCMSACMMAVLLQRKKAKQAEDHSSSLSILFEQLEEECLLAELRLRKTLGVMRIENHTQSAAKHLAAHHDRPFAALRVTTGGPAALAPLESWTCVFG